MSNLRIMEKLKTNVLSEISALTLEIEQDYPELLKYLDETRSTLPHGNENNSMDMKSLEDYRETLKELIQSYGKNRK